MTERPGSRREHHRPGGGFTNPWPVEGGERSGGFLRWRWQRLREGVSPSPPSSAFPHRTDRIERPRAGPGELRITWVGHSTFLLQLGTVNMLVDPMWSERASPVRWAGPLRLTPPGLPLDALPPIDAVIVSHDHYDHLDRPTVDALRGRFGPELRWITPLGYRDWFARRGVTTVTELDWWQSIAVAEGAVEVVALPSQHWTRRTPWPRSYRLWASFAVLGAEGARVYFAGDSGYFPGFEWIGAELGPWDAALLPIGAYEPRWFMKPAHMNPEEAVRAYLDLGGTGTFAGMHWGTFRLADEDPLEPPRRTRAAWREAGLAQSDLWIPRPGETRVLRARHAMDGG